MSDRGTWELENGKEGQRDVATAQLENGEKEQKDGDEGQRELEVEDRRRKIRKIRGM